MESYYSAKYIYHCTWGTLSPKSPRGEIHRPRQAPLKLSSSTLAGPRDSPVPPPLLLVTVTTYPNCQVSPPFLRGSGSWSLCPPVGPHLKALQSLYLPSFKTEESPEWATEGLPQWLSGEESTSNAGDTADEGSIPGPERSPGEGNGNPLQYSFFLIF